MAVEVLGLMFLLSHGSCVCIKNVW